MMTHIEDGEPSVEKTGTPRLRPGDILPSYTAVTLQGDEVPYEKLWQHSNVVLFVLSVELSAAASSYLAALDGRVNELKPYDTFLIISHHPIAGVPENSLVIADRWGEIAHVADLESDPTDWPSIADIVEWVEFIRMQCPECPP
jgi:hypothetical protein